jgi:O-antigen ligase
MKPDSVFRSVVPWLGIAVVAAVAGAIEPRLSLVPIGLLIGVAVWRWMDSALDISVFVILAIRSALDLFSDSRDPTASLALRPASAAGLVIMLIASIIAARRIRSGRPLWPDVQLKKAHYWLGAAYGIGILAGALGYGADGLQVGLREAARVGSTIAALLLVLWWVEDHPERYRTGWTLLILGTVLPLVVAGYQYFTGTGYLETEGLNRLRGTFSHPNSLGPFLVPFILIAVGGVPSSSWGGRISRLAFASILIVVLLLTYSRTALLVLLTSAGVLPLLYARKLGARALGKGIIALGLLMALGWGLGEKIIEERFAGLATAGALDAVEGGPSENSFTWRLLNWGILVRLGMERPIAGHGAGMTTVLNPLVNVDYGGKPFNAHNDYVRFFFESGVLGLLCYIVYGALLCLWAMRRARTASARAAPGAFAVAASLLGLTFLTLGTTELSLQTAILYQLYGMLALLTVVPVEDPLLDTRGRGVGAPLGSQIGKPGIATSGAKLFEDFDV